MNEQRVGRREFLRLSSAVALGSVLAACAPAGEEAGEQEQPTAAPQSGAEAGAAPEAVAHALEAPMLAAMVESGELPPLEERLPVEPYVVGPGLLVHEDDLDWEVGEYSKEGEVLRSVTYEPDWSYPCQHALEHILNTPKHYTGPVTPNLCSWWTVNEELTQYEFTLRKGLRWSDGQPVTTEDIRFAYEDVLMNEELTSVLGETLRAGAEPSGEPMDLQVVDDFTFTITFAKPNGRFLLDMGVGGLWEPYCFLLQPAHYLKQFHKDYTPMEEIEPLLAAEGLGKDEWYRLCLDKGAGWWGGGCEKCAETMPVLRGWVVKESPDDLIIMERNPYYHKVDTEGKQLPYVDRIEGVVVSDIENMPAKIINGEANYIRERLHHQDIALYREHEAENDYKVCLDLVYHNAPVALFLNYNNLDETWRQVVGNKDFRYGINAAIDYREILQTIYLGMGDVNPWLPDVSDVDEANRYLDAAGLDQRDADGWRLAPNGERFEFILDVRLDPLYVQPAELIKAHLEDVGIHTPLKSREVTLWREMRDANEFYASIDWLDDCNWPYLKWDYMPNSRIKWAQLWHKWMRTDGAEGEEPPEWIKDLYAIDAELRAVDPNTGRGRETEQRFADWFREYIPIFPLARDVVDPIIVPKNLGNLAHSGRSSAVWFAQEQVFFKHS